MANVFTKKNHLPMNVSARDYNDRAFSRPPGSLVAVINDPRLKLPPYERPMTIPDPKRTINTAFRESYQSPRFDDDMLDEMNRTRHGNTHFKVSPGIVPCVDPVPYQPVHGHPAADN